MIWDDYVLLIEDLKSNSLYIRLLLWIFKAPTERFILNASTHSPLIVIWFTQSVPIRCSNQVCGVLFCVLFFIFSKSICYRLTMAVIAMGM